MGGGNRLLLRGLRWYGSVAQIRAAVRNAARWHHDFAEAKKLPAELLRVNAQTPEAEYLRYAADFLARGAVIAIPTDTMYGLAADPFQSGRCG